MHIFEKPGRENTKKTLEIAAEKAERLQTSIVIASNTGSSAEELLHILEERGSAVPVVVVTSVYGMKAPGENQFPGSL